MIFQEEQRKLAAITRAEGDSKAAELLAKALGGTNLFIPVQKPTHCNLTNMSNTVHYLSYKANSIYSVNTKALYDM